MDGGMVRKTMRRSQKSAFTKSLTSRASRVYPVDMCIATAQPRKTEMLWFSSSKVPKTYQHRLMKQDDYLVH
jgi:hypothetical protein